MLTTVTGGTLMEQPRFRFGQNWLKYARLVEESRVRTAEGSLRKMLDTPSLSGRRFLDIGSGSGLFSLAAHRLGAEVVSFDFDADSVECTRAMKQRFAPESGSWRITQGSVLDRDFVRSLGQFEVVYSWGVLHHTGALWDALENACERVCSDGKLFVAVYNDQGNTSSRWKAVKEAYSSNALARALIVSTFVPYFVAYGAMVDIAKARNPYARYRDYKKKRGMSKFYDWFDWLGGFPFEVARPEEVFAFCQQRGFELSRLTTQGGWAGNNEFVFRRAMRSVVEPVVLAPNL